MNNSYFIVFFLAIWVVIIVVIGIWFGRRWAERFKMADDDPQTEEEILNQKVPKEKGYVVVAFGKDVIQLTPEQFMLWNSWTRERKRMFVREFKKAKDKGQVRS